MAWPAPSIHTADALDSALDDPVNALPILLDTVNAVQTIITARASADGICDLDATGKVPAARLGDLSYYANAVVQALGAVTAAPDKLPYFTGTTTASVSALTAYARTLLAAADAAAALTVLGATIGTDVQAWSAELDNVVAAGELAQTSGVDASGNPVPLAGYFMRGEDGGITVVPPEGIDMTAVNAAIASAIDAYAANRDLSDYLTATEAAWLYMPVSLFGAAGLALAAAANAEAARLELKLQGDTNIRFDLPFILNSYSPLSGSAVGTGGNIALANGEAGHPGCVDFRSGTASGGGYKVYGNNKMLLLSGGESLRTIVKFPSAFTTITYLFGFSSSGSIVEPADGAYFWLSGDGVLTPKTANGSTRTSGSTVTLSTATWYTLRITVNADATGVLFEVENDAGTVLLSQNITTNIPKTATHEVGPIVAATSTDTSGTLSLVTIDHFNGYFLQG